MKKNKFKALDINSIMQILRYIDSLEADESEIDMDLLWELDINNPKDYPILFEKVYKPIFEGFNSATFKSYKEAISRLAHHDTEEAFQAVIDFHFCNPFEQNPTASSLKKFFVFLDKELDKT